MSKPARIKKLHIGSLDAPIDTNYLEKHNITYIINLSKISYAKYDNIKYLDIPIDDAMNSDMTPYFDQAIEFISKAFRHHANILVHCAAGISRSATIVIAYLVKKYGMTVAAAHKYLAASRPAVAPNEAFLSQLKRFEKEVGAKSTKVPADLMIYSHEPPKSDVDINLAKILASMRSKTSPTITPF
jgi:predicted protein tyrosine phosphatase